MCREIDYVREQIVIVYELIEVRWRAERISQSEANALQAGVNALTEQRGDTQEGRLLSYIVRNMDGAYLFRDAYTMRALRAVLEALQRKEERLMKDAKK